MKSWVVCNENVFNLEAADYIKIERVNGNFQWWVYYGSVCIKTLTFCSYEDAMNSLQNILMETGTVTASSIIHHNARDLRNPGASSITIASF